MTKWGIISAGTTGRHGVMWDPRGCDMACKALWQRHADPRACLRDVDVARTRGKVTRAHTDAWVVPRGMRSDGLMSDGPTGIVGPGYSIGVVTHLRYVVPHFILAISLHFFRVGLCSL